MYGDTTLIIGNGTGAVTVADGATLTINGKNVTVANALTVDKGGKVVINATKVDATAHGLANVKGELIINANTTVNSTGHVAIDVFPNANVTLNGTIDNATTVVRPSPSYNKVYGDKDAVVTVSGGTYKTTADAFVVDNGYVLNINNANVEAGARVLHLSNGKATISNGEFVAKTGTGIFVDGTSEDASLTISGGKVTALGSKYALSLTNPKATYAISGGTFESTATKGMVAIELGAQMFDTKTGKLAIKGILTGGKYLNNIIGVIRNTVGGANYDPATDLVAEGYTVKEEGNYKVVVSTKAENDKKPAAKPEEQAPNTYDAGLVYMGLALSAIGASVVSVRKLRNN